MKKYIVYALAALIGFHLRWVVFALNGWTGYRMNGADIIVSLMCIVIVWSFRGLLPQKKKTRPRANAQKRKRQ